MADTRFKDAPDAADGAWAIRSVRDHRLAHATFLARGLKEAETTEVAVRAKDN